MKPFEKRKRKHAAHDRRIGWYYLILEGMLRAAFAAAVLFGVLLGAHASDLSTAGLLFSWAWPASIIWSARRSLEKPKDRPAHKR